MNFNILSILTKGELTIIIVLILASIIGLITLKFLEKTERVSLYNAVGITTMFLSIGASILVCEVFSTYDKIDTYGEYQYEIKYGDRLKSSYFTNDYHIENGILSIGNIQTSEFIINPNKYYKDNYKSN